MSTLWQQATRLLDHFWFTPGTARNLAVARMVTAATALWVLLSRDLPALSGTPEVFWSVVPWTTRWRYLLFPGHTTLEQGLQALALVALSGVLLGIWPRCCAFVASVLLYHLAPLEAIFWTNTPYIRGFDTPVLALMALALAPSGDAWSLAPRTGRPCAPSWAYHWPVRFIQVQISYIYMFSGYSKLIDVGFSWAAAENIQAWMLAFNQGIEGKPLQHFGLWLAAQPWLCRLVGIGTLLFEVGFFMALVSKRCRRAVIVMALLFHLGILVMMNITVLYIPFLLVFIDWGPARAGHGPPSLGQA